MREQLTNEVLQRITAMESTMDIILAERPKIQDELLNIEKKIVENQRDVEFNNKQIEEMNAKINKFLWSLGATGITVIGALLSIIFGK